MNLNIFISISDLVKNVFVIWNVLRWNRQSVGQKMLNKRCRWNAVSYKKELLGVPSNVVNRVTHVVKILISQQRAYPELIVSDTTSKVLFDS